MYATCCLLSLVSSFFLCSRLFSCVISNSDLRFRPPPLPSSTFLYPPRLRSFQHLFQRNGTYRADAVDGITDAELISNIASMAVMVTDSAYRGKRYFDKDFSACDPLSAVVALSIPKPQNLRNLRGDTFECDKNAPKTSDTFECDKAFHDELLAASTSDIDVVFNDRVS